MLLFRSLGRSDSVVKQTTVRAATTFQGVGVHSGRDCTLSVQPAPAGHGLVFYRTDRPGTSVPASHEHLGHTSLATNLVLNGEKYACTVEHLLSALAAASIDNARIEIDSPEIPIMDGSASEFFAAFQKVGTKELPAPRKWLRIRKTVRVSTDQGTVQLSSANQYLKLDVTIDFDHPAIQRQGRCFTLGRDNYQRDIARARTFCTLQQVEAMKAKGLGAGGSAENALVFGPRGPINPEGVRYDDECVRHKILDSIGDLSLCGYPIIGVYEGVRCGHALNVMAVREMMKDPDAWCIEERSADQKTTGIQDAAECSSRWSLDDVRWGTPQVAAATR